MNLNLAFRQDRESRRCMMVRLSRMLKGERRIRPRWCWQIAHGFRGWPLPGSSAWLLMS